MTFISNMQLSDRLIMIVACTKNKINYKEKFFTQILNTIVRNHLLECLKGI